MFPEYQDHITKLRQDDPRFEKIFNQHNELDQKITRMEKTQPQPFMPTWTLNS